MCHLSVLLAELLAPGQEQFTPCIYFVVWIGSGFLRQARAIKQTNLPKITIKLIIGDILSVRLTSEREIEHFNRQLLLSVKRTNEAKKKKKKKNEMIPPGVGVQNLDA